MLLDKWRHFTAVLTSPTFFIHAFPTHIKQARTTHGPFRMQKRKAPDVFPPQMKLYIGSSATLGPHFPQGRLVVAENLRHLYIGNSATVGPHFRQSRLVVAENLGHGLAEVLEVRHGAHLEVHGGRVIAHNNRVGVVLGGRGGNSFVSDRIASIITKCNHGKRWIGGDTIK